LSLSHRSWVEGALKTKEKSREDRWSESIAVGSLSIIQKVKSELGARGSGRNIISSAEGHELREPQISYRDHFGWEMAPLSYGNKLRWLIYDDMAM
jgi:putative transposase